MARQPVWRHAGRTAQAEQAVLFRQLRRDAPGPAGAPDDLGADRRGPEWRLHATGTTVYDPFTGNPDGTGRTPFAGSVIPQNRMSDVARKLLAFMPMPNLPGEMDNYFVQPRFPFNRWTVDSKVNWNATDRLQIFGRYSQLDFYQNTETVFGDQLQGDDATGGGNPGMGWGNTFNLSTGAPTLWGATWSLTAISAGSGWAATSK